MSIFQDSWLALCVTEWDEESFLNILFASKTIYQNLLPFKSQHFSRFPWYNVKVAFLNIEMPKLNNFEFGIEGMPSGFFVMDRIFFPNIPIDPLYAEMHEPEQLNDLDLSWLNRMQISTHHLYTKYNSLSQDRKIVPLLNIEFHLNQIFWKEDRHDKIFYHLERHSDDRVSIYAKIGTQVFKVANNLPQFLSDLHMFFSLFCKHYYDTSDNQREYRREVLDKWPRNERSFIYDFCSNGDCKSGKRKNRTMSISGCKTCPDILFCDECMSDAEDDDIVNELHQHPIETINFNKCEICRSLIREGYGQIFTCDEFHNRSIESRRHRKHRICFGCCISGNQKIEDCICQFDDLIQLDQFTRFCDICFEDIEYPQFCTSRMCSHESCFTNDQCDKCLDRYKTAQLFVRSRKQSPVKINQHLSKKQRKARAIMKQKIHRAKRFIKQMEKHQKRTGHGWTSMLEPIVCPDCQIDCTGDFWICNKAICCHSCCLLLLDTLPPEQTNQIVHMVDQKATGFYRHSDKDFIYNYYKK